MPAQDRRSARRKRSSSEASWGLRSQWLVGQGLGPVENRQPHSETPTIPPLPKAALPQPARPGPSGQVTIDQIAQRGVCAGKQAGYGFDITGTGTRKRKLRVVFVVGRLSAEHLVEQRAHREEVASPIEGLAPRLLGRHVPECAACHHARGRARADVRARNAEVCELDLALDRNERISRTQITMYQAQAMALIVAQLMHGLERCEHVVSYAKCEPFAYRFTNKGGQRSPLNELEDHERA